MQVAIVDLDGPGMVVNTEARAKEAYAAAGAVSSKQHDRAYYGALFNPDLVGLDTLQPGAHEQVWNLMREGWTPIYLTSRPESMRAATEAWLLSHHLTAVLLMKDYGTDEDPRDRFMKTSAWKAREVKRILADMAAASPQVIFIDDQVENRLAVADLHDPRIIIKYSLQDALETDQWFNYQLDGQTEIMRFLQELTNAACCRSRFETGEDFELRVQHKPDEQGNTGMPLILKVFDGNITLTELYPERHEDGSVIEYEVLKFILDDAGHTEFLFLDQGIPGSGLAPIFEGADEEYKREGYADWKAAFLRESGYLAAAKYQREVLLWPERALAEYEQAREEAMLRIQETLRKIREAELINQPQGLMDDGGPEDAQ